ncbi:MAG: metallophosphoesterase [Clostridiales bacterium]|nr:metallophosphoesterase [Clostridiales bacterium]
MTAKRRLIIVFVIFIIASLPLCLFAYNKQRTSLPEELNAPLSFLYFSDTQADPKSGDYSPLRELLTQAVSWEQQPVLAIFGGDTINDGGDATEWQAFWQAVAAPLARLVTAAIAGNHDSHPLLAEQFDYPQQAPLTPGQGFFYSFDLGLLHFIMLDSNIMGAANQVDMQWLENDLNSATARQAAWRIAVIHHPLWPLTDNPKDLQRAAIMRENFLPLLRTGDVDLILCGHQHLYGRSLLMQGTEPVVADGGIIQIMVASGAKESYVAGQPDYLAISAPAPNYLLLTTDWRELSITAYNEHGEIIDKYTLTR